MGEDDTGYQRAEWLLRRGDASAALDAARAARHASPVDAGPRCVEAVALAHLGHRDSAEAAADAVLKAAPRDPRALLASVEVDLVHGRRRPNTILRARRAVRLAPASAEAHRWFGAAFMVNGDMVVAGEKLRAALHIDPAHPGALADLAVVEQWEAAFEGRSGAAAQRQARQTLLRKRLHDMLQLVMVAMLVANFAFVAWSWITGMDLRYAALFVCAVGPGLVVQGTKPLRDAGGPDTWRILRSLTRSDRFIRQQTASLVGAVVLFGAAAAIGRLWGGVLMTVACFVLYGGTSLMKLPGYRVDPEAIGGGLTAPERAER